MKGKEKAMDQKSMVKQVFDFHRSTFDNFIKSVFSIQDQAEKSVSLFLDRAPWLPEDGKNMIVDWGSIYKKGREDFKRAVDDGYDKMESYLTIATQAVQQAAQQTSKATSETGKKTTEAAAKSSESGKSRG
jgi:hypothetical protein